MSDASTFVVFRNGAWSITTVPGRTATATTVADVVSLLAEEGEVPALAPPSVGSARDGAIGPGTVVSAVPSFVGALDHGRLRVVAHDGRTHLLGPSAVELLDALSHGGAAEDVAEHLEIATEEVVSRLERLGPRFVRVHEDSFVPDGPVVAVDEPWTRPRARPAEAGPPPGDDLEGRIPVYAIWHDPVGPSLSLGMLTAAARQHDHGRLTETYEIRRPEHVSTFLRHVADVEGPAVLLCSDYVWCLEDNLAAARAALAVHPDLIVVHGGPSSPKYEAEAAAFLRAHGPAASVLVRGEGEQVLCQLLEALREDFDLGGLRSVAGLTFVDPRSGDVVRTEDQPRIADLDALPSPYLSGEFDHIPPEAWDPCLTIETNRGCPYGCTFCDWGSSTMSRIRKFGLARVAGELEWAAERSIWSINLADANFGIIARDVQIAELITATAHRHGFPRLVNYYPAKNTTKHLARIMDSFLDGGVGPVATLSLQTTDPATLEAIERSNITTDHYVALTAEFRRRGLPLQGDLLLGLPGQTYEGYRGDLQHHIDHEVVPRTWQVRVLPNAPINDPAYRARHRIVVDDAHRVRSTTSFSEDDRARMMRLRGMEIVAERYGVLRHVMRWLQWDHGIEATVLLDSLLELVLEDPTRLPLVSWTFEHFDLFQCPAVGWGPFYDEVWRYIVEDLEVVDTAGWETVRAVQMALMPEPGRRFPVTVRLAHDYVAYYRDATAELFASGRATLPSAPLRSWAPGSLVVSGDPLGLCTDGLTITGDPRDELFESDYLIGANSAYELASPLMRLLPHVAFAARDDYQRHVRSAVGTTAHELPMAPEVVLDLPERREDLAHLASGAGSWNDSQRR